MNSIYRIKATASILYIPLIPPKHPSEARPAHAVSFFL